MVNNEEPPDMVAVNNAVPPIQTSLLVGVMETVASGLTITVATFETGSSQSGKLSVINTR